MDNDIILRTMPLIKDKYPVGDNTALKYANMALNALESHGGSVTDFPSIIRVIDVVVKSWLEKGKM